ncbi:4,5-dihydroxyphthalate decarboxylase [Halosimplex pelagicum]|uniref:4,5-dihydroxyphthalate decarboxylase n=1 Tax=Halosimplex pelagicum TaxID=869886 RepID=A0A7D5TB09_9EURY|nr:4,5-dihydroxyphthalate decarboxylase [Halosimplex pelagicum]QLH81729.1 4,5-dihydroxyphthalate decarboxylase [Halosimplex pelagicum]
MALDLSLAVHPYAWTQPLRDGRVEPEGVNLSTVNYPNPVRFSRMVRDLEFDACELSMGTYLATRRNADRFPFTALPIFPFRKFRHAYMYVREGAGIDSVADLAGARVGIVNWQTTTGIWQRGILADRHGLDLESVEWVAGGSEIVDIDVPERFDVEYVGHQGSTIGLLEDTIEHGEIDAIFHPVDAGIANARRLFDDAKAVEQTYYRETGIFPVMHAVVVRDEILDEHPWVVQPLYDAFERSKEIGLSALERPRELPLVWADVYADEQRTVLGEDPWEYGLTEANVTAVETLAGYAHDQGVAAERYDVGDLFATDHLDTDYYA